MTPWFSACVRPDELVEENDSCILTHDCGAVSAKWRPMIVLIRFAEHMLCMPMFTANARGIESRKHDVIQEYAVVRPSRRMMKREGIEKCKDDSTRYPPVTIEEFERPVSEDGYVQLSMVVCVDYKEQARKAGHIGLPCYERLMALWLGVGQAHTRLNFPKLARMAESEWVDLDAEGDVEMRAEAINEFYN